MIYHDLIMISSILYMDLNLNCWELPKKDGDLTGNAGNQINQTVKHGDFSPMMVHDVKGYKRIKQRLQRGTANPGNRLWSLMICKCCASATAARCHEKMSAAVVFSQRILTNSRVTHFCVDGKDGPRHGRNSRIPWAHEPLNWQYCGVWWMDGIPPLVICIRTNHSSPTNQWSQRSPFFQSSEPSVISSVAQFVQPPQKKIFPKLTDFLHRTVSPCRVKLPLLRSSRRRRRLLGGGAGPRQVPYWVVNRYPVSLWKGPPHFAQHHSYIYKLLGFKNKGNKVLGFRPW